MKVKKKCHAPNSSMKLQRKFVALCCCRVEENFLLSRIIKTEQQSHVSMANKENRHCPSSIILPGGCAASDSLAPDGLLLGSAMNTPTSVCAFFHILQSKHVNVATCNDTAD